jgi:hypothetical protein
LIFTARFKPSISAKIFRANLKVFADNKDLALKTERPKGETKAKLNDTSFLINSVEKNEEEIDALRYGNNRRGYNRKSQGGSSPYRGGEQEEYNNGQPNRDIEGYSNYIRGEEETNPKTIKLQSHYKEEAGTLLPQQHKLDNGVPTAKNLLTTQPNVGVIKRRM